MKRLLIVAFLSFFCAGAASAQRHKLAAINAETPEGQLLQQIGQAADAAAKMPLMEQFSSQYPKHEAIGWVLSQLTAAYLKAGQFDKAMEACEKLLAIDDGDAETAYTGLQAAEGKKDPELVRKWASLTSKAAKKAAVEPKPAAEEEQENWKARIDYAKQVDTRADYSLYAMALGATDPKVKIELVEALQAQNPNSEHLAQLAGPYFMAIRQTGNVEKAVAVAEKTLEKDHSSEDMLLVAADYYMNTKKNPEKALTYSLKLVEVMGSKPKPEGVSDADWEKRKDQILGIGNWMAGVTYSGMNKFGDADKSLRASLPYIKENDQLLAGAYFHLGLANYRLGDPGGKAEPNTPRMLDALKFNQQCAAIKSPYQAQAQKNIAVIRSKYRIK